MSQEYKISCVSCGKETECSVKRNRKFCDVCGKERKNKRIKEIQKRYREDPFNRYMNSFRALRAKPIKIIGSSMPRFYYKEWI